MPEQCCLTHGSPLRPYVLQIWCAEGAFETQNVISNDPLSRLPQTYGKTHIFMYTYQCSCCIRNIKISTYICIETDLNICTKRNRRLK